MILVFYIILFNIWRINFSDTEIEPYISEIKQAEKLPELFYELYNLDTNNSLEYGTLNYLTKSFSRTKNHQPVSIWLARMIYIPKLTSKAYPKILKLELSLATKIENETSSKEQLNFMLKQIDFVNGQVGVKSAAKYYFYKELNELNKTEVANLIVMTRNPSFYNPKKRAERLKLEVEKLLKK